VVDGKDMTSLRGKLTQKREELRQFLNIRGIPDANEIYCHLIIIVIIMLMIIFFSKDIYIRKTYQLLIKIIEIGMNYFMMEEW
jgi:hypothetical protein